MPQSTAASAPASSHAAEYHRARAAQVSGRVRPEPPRHPRPDHVVPAGQPPGHVGVQALDPLAGAADSPARTRARSSRRESARRVRRRNGDGRRPAPPRPPAASASRTPPAASSRPTRTRSSGSTSQYRVGMGVPSRRKGSLAMTTGGPSARRTTTVKAPPGSRPSRRATASASPRRSAGTPRPARGSTPEFEGLHHARQQAARRRRRRVRVAARAVRRRRCAPAGVVVVVVTPPGGSSGVADGVTGPSDPGSPAYGVPAAVAPEGGSTS